MGLRAAQDTPPHGVQHLMAAAKLLSQLSSSKLGLYCLYFSPQPIGKDALSEKEKSVGPNPPPLHHSWRTTSYNPEAGEKLRHLKRPESF